MANVFISHTGADSGWAREIYGWLSEDGHQVFLDWIAMTGCRSAWSGSGCCMSGCGWPTRCVCGLAAYFESVWCAAEIGAARALGAELLPVRVTGGQIDDRLLTLLQFVDAAADPADARKGLRFRLGAIDGAGGWGWPDDKSPYPGLRPFELGDHRVFFGRSRSRSPRSPSGCARLTATAARRSWRSSGLPAAGSPRWCAPGCFHASPATRCFFR